MATNADGLSWIDSRGATADSLAIDDAIIDMHFNPARQRIHVLTKDGVQDYGPDGAVMAFHRLRSKNVGAARQPRVWGTPSGFVTTSGDRQWHEYRTEIPCLAADVDCMLATEATQVELTPHATRSLPRATSMWGSESALSWVGIEPQRGRPALVETTTESPLADARVSDPPFDEVEMIAPAPGGQLAIAFIDDQHLHIRIAGLDVEFSIDSVELAGLVHLGAARYAIAGVDGDVIIADWRTGTTHMVYGASWPLAGPLPCPLQ